MKTHDDVEASPKKKGGLPQDATYHGILRVQEYHDRAEEEKQRHAAVAPPRLGCETEAEKKLTPMYFLQLVLLFHSGVFLKVVCLSFLILVIFVLLEFLFYYFMLDYNFAHFLFYYDSAVHYIYLVLRTV